MNAGYDDLHGLSGAYAVDALDAEERARFEAHLADCPDCRAEVASLAEVSALLPTDAIAPPASLRESLMAQLDSVAQLPPATEAQPDPDAAEQPPAGAGEPHQARSVDGRRRFPGPAGPVLLMAAAVLAVLMVAGAAWWRPWADDPAPLTVAERVLAATDAVRASQELSDGSRATVVVSPTLGRAVVVTEDMAPAPAGRDYQLWLLGPSGDLLPAGLMPDRPDATVLLEGDASEAAGVGITVEPDGGSAQPTTEPLVFVEVKPASTRG